MANIFVNIPVPAANGSGAAVDMSAFGLQKTISLTGPMVATVTIEISNELVPTKWAPLTTFIRPDGLTLDIACRWMRATVQGYRSGAPVCDVGGDDAGTLFASLPATPGNGAGAAVDVSALGPFKTVTVGGPFAGNVQLEVSEDGIANWSQLGFGFGNPGQQSQSFIAAFMRVVRSGVPGVSPGLPIVDVGACSIGGGGAVPLPTDGGEAGVTGSGTALDPFVPVGGPFRPVTDVFVMDDYLVSYGPQPGGVSNTLGVGYTSILKTAGVSTQFSVNDAAGPLGPGVGSMMGVMDLQLIGASNNQYITATQFRPGDDSGTAIDMSRLVGAWDLWMSARVSFEGLNDFETQQLAWAGFWSQIDQPSFNLANREGAYFHPKDNGLQVNWFARYRIFDDSGVVTADIDTGVRVGFTAAHPLDGRAAQNLLVRMQGPAAAASLTMAIDGVTVVGPIALVNPTSRFTPMCAIESIAAAESNTMYVDWMLWGLKGRTV